MRLSVLAALALVLATPGLAHGPTPLKVDETVIIAADPQRVWALAGSFGAIAKWHPDIKSVQATGGDALGGERILTFQNGATLKESLDEFDPSSLKYSYRMLDPNLEALPVSSYSMTLAVRPASSDGKCTISCAPAARASRQAAATRTANHRRVTLFPLAKILP